MKNDGSLPIISRRAFSGSCAALVLSLRGASGIAATLSRQSTAATDDDFSNGGGRTVKFANGIIVPAVGQGSWHLGQGRHPSEVEEEALRIGLSL